MRVIFLLVLFSCTHVVENPITSDEIFIPLEDGLEEVIKVSKCLKTDNYFINEIMAIEKFSSTHDSPPAISEKLKTSLRTAYVGFYEKKLTNVVAYRQGNYIYFNRLKIRSDRDKVGTLIHEYLHLLGYDHKSSKDLNSVPYKIGYLARDSKSLCHGE